MRRRKLNFQPRGKSSEVTQRLEGQANAPRLWAKAAKKTRHPFLCAEQNLGTNGRRRQPGVLENSGKRGSHFRACSRAPEGFLDERSACRPKGQGRRETKKRGERRLLEDDDPAGADRQTQGAHNRRGIGKKHEDVTTDSGVEGFVRRDLKRVGLDERHIVEPGLGDANPGASDRARVAFHPHHLSRGTNQPGSQQSDVADAGTQIEDALARPNARFAETSFGVRSEPRSLPNQALVFGVGVAQRVLESGGVRRHARGGYYHALRSVTPSHQDPRNRIRVQPRARQRRKQWRRISRRHRRKGRWIFDRFGCSPKGCRGPAPILCIGEPAPMFSIGESCRGSQTNPAASRAWKRRGSHFRREMLQSPAACLGPGGRPGREGACHGWSCGGVFRPVSRIRRQPANRPACKLDAGEGR
jgi:hypothetical protein